jgi:hypothetical protein
VELETRSERLNYGGSVTNSKVPELTVSQLLGGHLAEVMAARMFKDEKLRSKFLALLGKVSQEPLDDFAQRFGWRPPAEVAEWEMVKPAYQALEGDVSDAWMLTGGLTALTKKKPDLPIRFNDNRYVLLLLTGLAHLGNDPDGDQCFVHTLPNPGGLASIHVFDHETGGLRGNDYDSISELIFSCFGFENEEEELSPSDEELLKEFHHASKTALPKRHNPHALFDRMKWLWSLPSGKTGYNFAKEIARAPKFRVWEREKAMLPSEPVLANYWLLAHFFLGNDTACDEAIELALKAPGEITPELARLVKALRERPAAGMLGKLDPKAIDGLRTEVRKKADPLLLEPALRPTVENLSVGTDVKADLKAIEARLKGGEDGWKLIAEFPDDVAAHDLVLKHLATRVQNDANIADFAMARASDKAREYMLKQLGHDNRLKSMLEDYAKARASTDANYCWPDYSTKVRPDPRLSTAVGAAFRAGLQFGARHADAAPALANTLAYFDDDAAMASFQAALEKLPMDDERLRHVVRALQVSKHPRARKILGLYFKGGREG